MLVWSRYADSRRVLKDKDLKGGELALFDLVGLTEGLARCSTTQPI